MRSNFNYGYIRLDNAERVGIVIDNDEDGYVSVTNDIENISRAIFADKIIYLDSNREWTYWERNVGYRSLHIKDGQGKLISPPTLDIAIDVAKHRYLKTISS